VNYPKVKRSLRQHINPLSEVEYKLLEQSCVDNGVRDALVTWNGFIVDGHHRLSIIKKHKLKFSSIEMDFENLAAAQDWMVINQLSRRNLNTFSKVAIALKLDARLKKRAKKNQRLRAIGEGFKKSGNHHVDDELATLAGCSRDTVYRVRKIVTHDDQELIQQLRDGMLSINTAFLKVRRYELHEDLISKPFKPGKYKIILMDCPFQYDAMPPIYRPTDLIPDYPTMTFDELAELPVNKLATKETVLFMWATNPMLFKALKLMEIYHLPFTGALWVWDKRPCTPIAGYYNKNVNELLLVGRKRSGAPYKPKRSESIIQAPKTRHSEKPELFRKLIDELYPHGKRIELFARKRVKNWDAWGNENELK